MRNNIIIMVFALCCTFQARASVQSFQADTVQIKESGLNNFELEPITPHYMKGVLVDAPFSGNWFVNLSAGTSTFIGSPLGEADLLGRMQPAIQFSFGRWLTPWIGARLGYQGYQFRDCLLSNREYHYISTNIFWNIFGGKYDPSETNYWRLSPTIGLGMMYNPDICQKPLALSYGLQAEYQFAKRVALTMELKNTTTFSVFDGHTNGCCGGFGEHLPTFTVGFSFYIGKTGWKKAIDAVPYIWQNEMLRDYANSLQRENRRYERKHEADRRTLDELEKILEIEGLLKQYADLFKTDTTDVALTYPRNDYSGLNSLRDRMRRRGNSSKGIAPSGSSMDVAVIQDDGTVISDTAGVSSDSPAVIEDYKALIESKNTFIGSPVYFFFEKGTSKLTDSLQLINLEALSRIAKDYGLAVRVSGAADSATGSESLNSSLSTSRANYISDQLREYGVPQEVISIISKGGISDFTPTEANRHTMVMLYFK